MRQFEISLLAHAKTSSASRVALSLEDFKESLTLYQERHQKNGGAWSPITWRGDTRADANFEKACALVYDLDWDDKLWHDEKLDELQGTLQRLGWVFVLHETFTEFRYRLVIPLASDLDRSNYQTAWETIKAKLGLSGPGEVDESGKDLARLFFLPAKPLGADRSATAGGERLCELPKLSHGAVDLGAVILTIKKARGKARDRILEALERFPKIPAGERHNTLRNLTVELVRAYPPAYKAWEGARPVMLAIAEASCEDASAGWLQEVENDLKRSWEFAVGIVSEELKTQQAIAPYVSGMSDTNDILAKLALRKDGVPRSSLNNIRIILEEHPEFKGKLRFNELSRRAEVSGGPLFEPDAVGNNRLAGLLDVALQEWLEFHLKMEVSKSDCGSAILLCSRRNGYNPVADYLNGLKWDGVPRVRCALQKYCEARGNQDYIATVSQKFFIAAVARALSPGCKVDTVLVLRGEQGTGKTTFVETLASKPWCASCSGSFESKDTIIEITENWLIELSELTALGKSSLEFMRGFITKPDDNIRIPYAAFHERFPRRAVFIGNTNSEKPLQDQDGNRRFWVVEVGDIDNRALARDRDQLWAEAVEMFKAHQIEVARGVSEFDYKWSWWFSKAEQEVSNRENALYQTDDTIYERLEEWAVSDEKKPEFITPLEIAEKVLRLPLTQVITDPKIINRIRKAAMRSGLIPTRGAGDLRNRRGFKVPDSWHTQEDDEDE